MLTMLLCVYTSVVLLSCILFIVFFFFQAEDGIRDYKVTGVQTCALPICLLTGGVCFVAARSSRQLSFRRGFALVAQASLSALLESQRSVDLDFVEASLSRHFAFRFWCRSSGGSP